MKLELQAIVKAVQSGISAGVEGAVRSLESSKSVEVNQLRERIDRIRRHDLKNLHKMLTDVRRSVKAVEALVPYLSLLDEFMRNDHKKPKMRRAPKKARRRPRRTKTS